jgi:hypothetical protein
MDKRWNSLIPVNAVLKNLYTIPVAAKSTPEASQTMVSTMKDFEAVLEKATERGSNGVPGAAMAVIDKHGIYLDIALRLAAYDFGRQLCLQERERLQWHCGRRPPP